LENGITIVFEIQDFIERLILGLGVGETFGGQEAQPVAEGLVALDEDALSVLEVSLALVLGHYYYFTKDIIYARFLIKSFNLYCKSNYRSVVSRVH